MRATTITHLFRIGVDPANIISRTGHKSTESLKPYIGQSSQAQMRQEADVLRSFFLANMAGPSGVTAGGAKNAFLNEEAAVVDTLTHRAITGPFTNCNITVNVTYNAPRQ